MRIRRLIDTVDHYEPYLHSQQGDEKKFRELLVRLRSIVGRRTKGPLSQLCFHSRRRGKR
jgi:hypothetical protein